MSFSFLVIWSSSNLRIYYTARMGLCEKSGRGCILGRLKKQNSAGTGDKGGYHLTCCTVGKGIGGSVLGGCVPVVTAEKGQRRLCLGSVCPLQTEVRSDTCSSCISERRRVPVTLHHSTSQMNPVFTLQGLVPIAAGFPINLCEECVRFFFSPLAHRFRLDSPASFVEVVLLD